MRESKKTLFYGGTALVLALLAVITAPGRVTPDAFLDQGELFFPDFQDPNEATTLEVIDFDSETGSPVPFKVTFDKGLWVIPSHHNYPADAKDRLAKTAAGIIEIRKDDFRTDNPADYAVCSVIDPLDESTAELEGRGKRVTIKNKNDKVLADIIIGKEIENRSGFRFVRLPNKRRVYASRMNVDISTKFTDWIESDLLLVQRFKINEVILRNYSINEQTLSVVNQDVVTLEKKDAEWTARNMRASQEVDKNKMRTFLAALDEMTIVGVRPKPAGLTAALTKNESGAKISKSDMLSLQSKGYYFTRDGNLRSNEGELQVRTDDGIVYTLRFGEVVYGSGLSVSAGTETSGEDKDAGENRYLFITASFEGSFFEEPAKPADTLFTTKPDSLWNDADRKNRELQDKYTEWQNKVENGRKLSDELNGRFAKWYYVISSEQFEKIHLSRSDLIKEKETTKKST